MNKLPRWYRRWDSMIARCYRQSHPAYRYYGGRGITVCDRWRNDPQAFLADMGEPPEGLWLDRINNDGNYEPGNCRWATPSQQAQNKRKRQQVPGSLRQRARASGLSYMLVYLRVKRGWPAELALTVPVQKRGGMTHHDKRQFGLMA